MISGDWKLMEYLEDNHFEIYNLHDDIGETKNLAASIPDRAKEMHAQMLAWRTAIKAPMPKPNTDIKPASTGGGGKGKKTDKQENAIKPTSSE